MTDTVLEVRNLRVEFATDEKLINAVKGIDFTVKRGQTLGIVGESGSGKSVTALATMGLLPSFSKINGELWFSGVANDRKPVDLLTLSETDKQQYRGSQIAMIFQEPMTSLNPVFTIGFQLTEAICQHQKISQTEARRQAASLLQEVKLLPSDALLQERYFEE